MTPKENKKIDLSKSDLKSRKSDANSTINTTVFNNSYTPKEMTSGKNLRKTFVKKK